MFDPAVLPIVLNPVAGRRRRERLWRVLDVLAAHGLRAEVAETRCPGHAERLARAAADAGCPVVAAAGGDGTIAEVAAGLRGTRAALGVVPLGTANVLAWDLGLPFAPEAIAASLAMGRSRPLWPGIAESGAGSRLFVQMLGAGFDARVVHALDPGLKRALGKGAYVLQSLREAARTAPAEMTVRVDGADHRAHAAIVSKGRLYGGRFALAPEASHAAPGFSVVLFDRGGALDALAYGAALTANAIRRMPGVRHVRARTVDFMGNAPVPLQADGDRAGFAPASVRDCDAPIRIVVPGGELAPARIRARSAEALAA
jgi:YegS/Rv2252/BmrU family lipid kinase